MDAGRELDAELIEASRKGDCSAFGQIVERYQRVVYAVSYASVRDRALSDDITQDTFVTAWRRLGALRETSQLPAWLCGIARNHARDARKRLRRDPASDPPELPDLVTPFDVLSDAESDRLIAVALAEVPDVYREALVLFYYEQRSVDDVARALGISAHTTNKRLSRGRQHLAARVEALVERKLTVRGPKRDLAACVLASIAVLGPAAPAEAALATKGSPMTKLAIATVIVASVGGAGLLAARPPGTTKAPPRPTASSSSAAAPIAHPTRSPAAAPAAKTGDAPVASRGRPQPSLPASSGSARSVPDCGATARYMAGLQLDALKGRYSADKRALFMTKRTEDLAARCTRENWSEERRLCVIGADDHESARVDCSEGLVATVDELASLPRNLACNLVGKHAATLMSAPGGKLALLATKLGAKFDLEQATEQMGQQQAAECERIPWSIAVRTCIVASKTSQDMTGCF